MDNYQNELKKYLEQAINEDNIKDDITSNGLFDNKEKAIGSFITKTPGVVSGVEVISLVISMINPKIKINILKQSGSFVNKGDALLTFDGTLKDLLKTERLCVNILEHMSGIATLTNKYVQELIDTNCLIMDSFHITPNFKILAKRAVVDGGGINSPNLLNSHYFITKNHLVRFLSIDNAINQIKKLDNSKVIEVEVTNSKEFVEALNSKCDIIRANIPNISELIELIKLNNHEKTIIVSSKVPIGSIRSVAKAGADYIIVNDITNNYKALQIEFQIYQ